ncbi:hypothetical protein KDW_13360 [Dictyobacter vulcani]|uniref:DUF4351 domain-containing protein n=1 Tax=Dictyobacter vulcani TaxID=2607529 RepID=A0A5J4KDM4_9CHLR|nr:hypothetical protein [Dictyobacter vulcani]GER87174.1 hypothetical protein KDW_13360 [Dictyobacter vulcani]
MPDNNYDELRNTWIYQEIQQHIQTQLQQQDREKQYQALYIIVQARFPRLLALVEQKATTTHNARQLQTLVIHVASARTEKEARRQLLDAASPS